MNVPKRKGEKESGAVWTSSEINTRFYQIEILNGIPIARKSINHKGLQKNIKQCDFENQSGMNYDSVRVSRVSFGALLGMVPTAGNSSKKQGCSREKVDAAAMCIV